MKKHDICEVLNKEQLIILTNNLLDLYIDILLHTPKEWVTLGFLPLETIMECPVYVNDWHTSTEKEEIYVLGSDYKDNKWNRFKEDIRKNGMYWPIGLSKKNEKWVITSGLHRYRAYTELLKEQKIPKNTKLLCYFSHNAKYNIPKYHNPFIFYVKTCMEIEDWNFHSYNNTKKKQTLKEYQQRSNYFYDKDHLQLYRKVDSSDELWGVLIGIAILVGKITYYLRIKYNSVIPAREEINILGKAFNELDKEFAIG